MPLFFLPVATQTGGGTFVNFEGALVSPVRLSPDGTRLFCVNTPGASLSVFDVTNPTAPALIKEIPVGIEPVSVNPRTNDEAWVVNQESDSVSVVSVSKGIVTDTIQAKDEPGDVVFAGTNAFVSIAKSNLINVYDVTTHSLVKSIPVFGGAPRAMAVSPNGTLVYAAFAFSGNGTTIIGQGNAPPPPPPTNPALPPAPQVGLIVSATDPAWASQINYTMPDNDVVAINSHSLNVVNYARGVGTLNLAIAVQPSTGFLFVPNTDALNLVRFQPNVQGHAVNNRLSRVAANGVVTAFDLNPGINYTILPNPAALSTALAQPTSAVFDGTGSNLYVAAFGTDRVALVSGDNGAILARIEIGPATGSTVAPATKRGPRGLAINNTTKTLYVMNRISNTISIVNTATNAVVTEIPTGSFDPTPPNIRNGRGFLYDAKLSGNGTMSCASCHLDGEMDHLAWDLGDPGGNMQTITSFGKTFNLHPMKGPMTTQMLRGLAGMAPYHWRGDRASFADFNGAFHDLMGGTPLSSSDLNAYTLFVNTIVYMPNPFQNLDRSLPTTNAQENGSPLAGQQDFLNFLISNGQAQHCNQCHVSNPGNGTNFNILILGGASQPFKVPQLRELYQKQFFVADGGPTIDGFGLTNDGSNPGTVRFLNNPFRFPLLRGQTAVQHDIASFVSTFDTGMAPIVGYTRTITSANVTNSQVVSDWQTLESQAASNCDLIAKGTIKGHVHGMLYQPAQGIYLADTDSLGPYTHAQVQQLIVNGDTLSFMGVPVGSGTRMGVNRLLTPNKDGDRK